MNRNAFSLLPKFPRVPKIELLFRKYSYCNTNCLLFLCNTLGQNEFSGNLNFSKIIFWSFFWQKWAKIRAFRKVKIFWKIYFLAPVCAAIDDDITQFTYNSGFGWLGTLGQAYNRDFRKFYFSDISQFWPILTNFDQFLLKVNIFMLV